MKKLKKQTGKLHLEKFQITKIDNLGSINGGRRLKNRTSIIKPKPTTVKDDDTLGTVSTQLCYGVIKNG